MNSRNIFFSIVLIFSAIISWQLRGVILIFFSSILVAVGLDILIEMLNKIKKLPRPISLTIVIVILVLIGSAVFQVLIPEVIIQAKELPSIIPKIISKIKSLLSSQPIILSFLQRIPEQFSIEGLQPFGSRLIGFAGGAANSFIQFLLISLLAILLVLDPKSHKNIVIAATPKRLRYEVSELLEDYRIALGGWLAGMTISAISIFILTWAGLYILNVPFALLSGFICGLFTFVPTIGPTISTLLPLGIALIISPTLMIQVLILRLFLQNIESFLITPLLLKKTVNLLPSFSLLSQLSLGALLGLPGVLIALPLAVVLQVSLQKIVVRKIMDKWE